MCGIVGARDGWLRQRGREPAAALRRAVAALAWRGPDAQGIERAGGWWLGCARLAITQAGSRQPVVRRGGAFAGVLNGALTSAREQWRQLLPGVEARPALPNDAWLPLLAAERGVDWTAAARGHFAAAVVDAASDRLLLWRDAAGEKPLFVFREQGEVQAFASTLPALRCLGVDAALPPAAVAQLFARGFAGAPTAAGGELDAAPPPLQPPLESPLASPPATAAAAELRARLLQAVRRCADVQVPAALCLSGGRDSSSLAAALAAVGRRLPAYQFRAAGEGDGERQLAAAVAAHCGLELRPVDGGPEVLDALPALTAQWGLPLGDPSLLAVHALARAAARDGVRVLLSGEGADELLLGYRRHRVLRWLPPRLPLPGWLLPRHRHGYAARWLAAAAAADPFAALQAAMPPACLQRLLAPELLAAVAEVPAPQPPASRRDLESARRRELDGYLRFDLLPKLDVATMAAGVEGRCPFLDTDVVAWALQQPARRLLGKRPLAAAFAAALPAAVFAQHKRGFALPLDRWFRGPLPWLDLLADQRTQRRPHLRPGGVAALLDLHRRRRADLGRALYLVVAHELHLRAREAEAACG